MLTFGDDVEWKNLGDLGNFYGGITGKSKKDFENGNAKFITYKNIFSNLAINQNTNDKVKIYSNEKQRTLKYGDICFTGSSETLNESGISSVVNEIPKEPLYLNSFCFFLRFNDISLFNPNFLKHLFRSNNIRKQIIKTSNGTTRFNISKELMKKIIIPIPNIETQNKIVEILDKFDKLCNNISEGIPAEIKLHNSRYEYYRNKLLTFTEI